MTTIAKAEVLMIRSERLPMIISAMVCLSGGLWTGLGRIGWNLPASLLVAHHGAIMVGGFLGTLISLEKTIPLKRKSLLLIPVFNGLSIIPFFAGMPTVAFYILIASSAALTGVFLFYLKKQRSIIYILMTAGSACWLVGNILLVTERFYPIAFPWWMAFVLLIIAAERLELMNFLPVSKFSKNILVTLLILFLSGVLLSFHGIGNLVCASALIGISVWLMRNDVVGINLKKSGVQKFVAISLLAGYTSLLLTGIFMITLPDQWLTYDALLHTFFIGFVFSMIFAHGPMILPGVIGISFSTYHKVFYGWLALLHVSLFIRIFADVTVATELRKISGMMTAIGIIGYFATLAILTVRNVKYAPVR